VNEVSDKGHNRLRAKPDDGANNGVNQMLAGVRVPRHKTQARNHEPTHRGQWQKRADKLFLYRRERALDTCVCERRAQKGGTTNREGEYADTSGGLPAVFGLGTFFLQGV
jgi:hypothetical protein